MNQNKPIRRHSTLRRFLMNAGYYTISGLRIPVVLIIAFLAMLAFFPMLLVSLYALAFDINYLKGNPQGHHTPGTGALVMSITAFLLLGGEYAVVRVVRAYIKLPEGHFLNPLPPAVNEILSEAEVLVRASSVSDIEQKKTLLRPAAGTGENDPQTLLRAADPASETD